MPKENANNHKENESETLENIEEEKKKNSHPLTKAEKFLEDTQQYEFLAMPKIEALDAEETKRRQKALKLIGGMLEKPSHTAAMLDYLGFYDWIKKYEKGFTKTAYDEFCTKVVMGQNGKAFKKYRLALNKESESWKHYKIKGIEEIVKEEYANIKNDLQ